MHPSHLSKVVFNTKISQPKIDMQVRIINFYSKREREYSHFFGAKYGLNGREKNGRRRVKIKGRWRGGRMVSLMYKVEGR